MFIEGTTAQELIAVEHTLYKVRVRCIVEFEPVVNEYSGPIFCGQDLVHRVNFVRESNKKKS